MIKLKMVLLKWGYIHVLQCNLASFPDLIPPGIARNEPSRARPDQWRGQAYLILVFKYI